MIKIISKEDQNIIAQYLTGSEPERFLMQLDKNDIISFNSHNQQPINYIILNKLYDIDNNTLYIYVTKIEG